MQSYVARKMLLDSSPICGCPDRDRLNNFAESSPSLLRYLFPTIGRLEDVYCVTRVPDRYYCNNAAIHLEGNKDNKRSYCVGSVYKVLMRLPPLPIFVSWLKSAGVWCLQERHLTKVKLRYAWSILWILFIEIWFTLMNKIWSKSQNKEDST